MDEDLVQDTMTGWDNPDLIASSESNVKIGAGASLLIALNFYIKAAGRLTKNDTETQDALQNLLSALDVIDWNAMDFTQEALDQGQNIYSNAEPNDVLIRYQKP